MTEKYSNSIDTTDPEPETEEEFLTDSESRDGEDFKGSSSSGGVALVMAVPIKSQSKPKMWLAAVGSIIRLNFPHPGHTQWLYA